MPPQHHASLSYILPTVFSSVLAGGFFALSIWAPLRLWQPLACSLNEHANGCDNFDPTVSLLGVAVAAFVHAICVAIFAWTPLSSPLRAVKNGSSRASSFNVFLYASMACDIVAYGHALTFMQGIAGFLQAATITFNAPFLVLAPYIIAAYNDPSTDLGAIVHRIKEQIIEYGSDDSLSCSCGQSNCVHKRLERAFLILPESGGSRGRQYDDHDNNSDNQEEYYTSEDEDRIVGSEMRSVSIPRFSLFVTAPADNAPEQYMPLPVSQRV